MTDKRISLAPVPLNLVNVSGEISSGSPVNEKSLSDTSTNVTNASNNDSIAFRVVESAAKLSPKKTSGK